MITVTFDRMLRIPKRKNEKRTKKRERERTAQGKIDPHKMTSHGHSGSLYHSYHHSRRERRRERDRERDREG